MTPAELKYLETSIATAPKEELVLKTFDVLILASTQALEKLRTAPNDIQSIHDGLRRGQQALASLMGALDFEIGGELARNLFRVYEYWHHELALANMRRDPERVARILPDFREYRKTWAEAIKQHRAERMATVGATARPAGAGPRGGSFAAVG